MPILPFWQPMGDAPNGRLDLEQNSSVADGHWTGAGGLRLFVLPNRELSGTFLPCQFFLPIGGGQLQVHNQALSG